MYSHSLTDLKREYRKQKTYAIVLLILAVIPAISGFVYMMFLTAFDNSGFHSEREGILTILCFALVEAFAFTLM